MSDLTQQMSAAAGLGKAFSGVDSYWTEQVILQAKASTPAGTNLGPAILGSLGLTGGVTLVDGPQVTSNSGFTTARLVRVGLAVRTYILADDGAGAKALELPGLAAQLDAVVLRWTLALWENTGAVNGIPLERVQGVRPNPVDFTATNGAEIRAQAPAAGSIYDLESPDRATDVYTSLAFYFDFEEVP